MSTVILPPDSEKEAEDILFEVPSDLDHLGRLGSSRLVVTPQTITRFVSTPTGEEVVQKWEIQNLSSPRTEQLVDASSLIAVDGGAEVELIRGTNRHTLHLTDAEKRLNLLIEGKPLPPLSDDLAVCTNCGRPLPKDTAICPYCVDRRKTLLRLFTYARPHAGRLAWGTFLTLLGTAMTLTPPYLVKHLVDDVLTDHKTQLFTPLLAALIGSTIMAMIIQIGRFQNIAFLGMKISVAIRSSLFEKMQELSLGFYDKRNIGSLMSRMINDTGALYDVLVDGIPQVLNQTTYVIGIPILLMVLNWKIALWSLVPVPIVVLGVRWFRAKMEKVWSRFWHNWSRLGSSLNGVLQGTRVVKAFNGENREVYRFENRLTNLAQTQYVAESSWAIFFPVIQFTLALSGFFTWYFGGRGVLDGQMTIGELTAFLAYVAMLQNPLQVLQRIMDWTTRALTAADRVFEILDTPVEVVDAADAKPMPDLKESIRFRDVHFGYDKAREVLHGIDLDVKPGEMIGIVGPSGSGKTTLINLLVRFYDPTQGHITFDGVDLRSIETKDLRKNVGVVLQESYLFPGSVRHNIAYGRPEATLEEIIEASKAANAHDFIVNFPDGYDTYVGERGQRLSGGERQRIAIARAILHNPKVLVLDEATASVDTETERMIQEALDNLTEGRTVFAIAHRLSTLRNADRLIVIEDGKVAEVGSHEELLQIDGGVYKKLVDMQLEMTKVRANFMME